MTDQASECRSQWRSQLCSAFASLCVLLGGYFFLQASTDGWLAWSAESARQLDILENPRSLPEVELIDSQGLQWLSSDFNRPIVLIDFIYTQCPTVCISLGLEFKQIQSDLETLGLDQQVQLLSLSFDLENDSPTQLRDYLDRFQAQDALWSAAVFASEADKNRTLGELGVIVIPDESLGFVHNTGVYLVVEGRVVEVFDYRQRSEILVKIKGYLG